MLLDQKRRTINATKYRTDFSTVFREYEEIIFDIESNWNSSDWSWIRFEEDTNNLVW